MGLLVSTHLAIATGQFGDLQLLLTQLLSFSRGGLLLLPFGARGAGRLVAQGRSVTGGLD